LGDGFGRERMILSGRVFNKMRGVYWENSKVKGLKCIFCITLLNKVKWYSLGKGGRINFARNLFGQK
jgi:hypothetical protein